MNKLAALVSIICAIAVAFISVLLCITSPAVATQAYHKDGHDLPVLQDTAQQEKIELTCQYPVLSSYAGLNYAFDINLNYTGGKDSKIFDLKATVPEGFNYTISPGYGDGKEIAAIRLDPNKGYPETVKLTVRPYVWKVPLPGEYPITMEASSGDIKSTINLKAIVTANYDMKITTPDGRLNTEATAGQDNNFIIVINNTGSANLEKISVESKASNRPSGWTVSFMPEKIDSLKAGDSKEVLVTMRPSDKTIAGDYQMTIEAEPESKYAYGNLQLRVTALTPTIWGWVGVGIVVLVIVALAIMFIRFGRR